MSDGEIINLKELIKEKERPAILIHNFPDPDAIASALAVSTLMKMSGLKKRRKAVSST